MRHRLSQKKHTLNYCLLSFLIPFLGFFMVMLIKHLKYGVELQYSMFYLDMEQQYYPFFADFRRTLRRGDSLFYTWNIGMGMDYLSIISYYLASPLNLLSVLLPDQWVLPYFSLLAPLKLGFAGMFFSIFLKNLFGHNDFSLAVFSSFYALCAWALGYHWNIMWLDTFALLPLVVLGTVLLLRDRKFILYTFSLFFSVYTNYYIGYMVCIFVFLLFFCYEISRQHNFKAFFADLGRIALFSGIALGMTAFLELPAFFALSRISAVQNTFSDAPSIGLTSLEGFKQLLYRMRLFTGNLGGGLEPTFSVGLPNLYCGIFTVLLAVLYILSSKISLREKICGFFLLLFLHLSFAVPQLNYFWHGFHFPNMIPYRFSFLYSFVLLVMAYKSWLLRNDFNLFKILFSAIVTAALFACSDKIFAPRTVMLGSLVVETPLFYIYNYLFLFIYTLVLLYPKLPKKTGAEGIPFLSDCSSKQSHMVSRIVPVICMIELLASLTNWEASFDANKISDYPKNGTEAALQYIKERENTGSLFRTEVKYPQALNDGALNGYHGVSTFASSVNVHVTNFMKALGFEADDTQNRFIFRDTLPVSNLFLGIKYTIDRTGADQMNLLQKSIYQKSHTNISENTLYLPLAFLVDDKLQDLPFDQSPDIFQFQNSLLSAASGNPDGAWNILSPESCKIIANQVHIQRSESGNELTYQNDENLSSITFQFTANQEGFLSISLDLSDGNKHSKVINNYSIKFNRTLVCIGKTILYKIPFMEYVQPGDIVEITLQLEPQAEGTICTQAAFLNEKVFQESYHILSESTMEPTAFRGDYLEGTIDCSRSGLLYTSIPQDGNWNVKVDGQPADPLLIGDCMLTVPLTQGKHIVSFQYVNTAFYIGMSVSILCLSAFVILICRKVYSCSKKKYSL